MLEKILESPLDCKDIQPIILKGNQSWIFIDWCWSWNSNTLATWCEELTHLKRPWFWQRLKMGGEGDDRGWDDWMASLTQWTWVWVGSGSWWWTGRPGMLQSMGSQRVVHDWVMELNWTDWLLVPSKCFFSSLPIHESVQWKIRLLCGNEGQKSPIFPFYLTRWLDSSIFSLIKMSISQLLYHLQISVTFSPALTLIFTI